MNIEKQNYKIKVANEAESREVQGLFFDLGYKWSNCGKSLSHLDANFLFAEEDGRIEYETSNEVVFNEEEHQKITLLQLRDLVILHRNDVSDATHKHKNIEGEKYYKTCDGNFFHFGKLGKWHYVGSSATNHVVSKHVVPIDQEQPQMTWQDALKKWIDGEEIEYFEDEDDEWKTLGWALLCSLKNGDITQFRVGKQIEINGKKLNWEEADSELKAFFRGSRSSGEMV